MEQRGKPAADKRIGKANRPRPVEIRNAILGGVEKTGFDTGRLSQQEFAARFCAALGLRLPYS
jgi:hypothetical protein